MNIPLRRAPRRGDGTLALAAAAILALPVVGAAQPAQDLSKATIRPLGHEINTYNHEYAPSITADGKTIFFTSDRPGGEGGHDFWYATKGNRLDSTFGEPVNLGAPINSSSNEGVASISADGKTIYFTGCNRADGVGDCDIYVAHLVNGVWTDVHVLTEINSTYWDTQPSISSDGRYLYFVSNRPTPAGDTNNADIYVSVMQSDGKWSAPQNLGAPINTPEREDSPFILPGGNVLYYSSSGHGGLGGLDFFYSTRQADGRWTTSENLGTPYSSPRDDRFLTLPASGDMVYFASQSTDPDDGTKYDIFMGVLPPRAVTILVQGRVFDEKSSENLTANLVFVDSATGKTLYGSATDPKSGNFSLVINAGAASTIQVYGFAQGYGPIAATIHVPQVTHYEEMHYDFPLQAVPSGVSAMERAGAGAKRRLVAFPNPTSKSITIDCSKLDHPSHQHDLMVTDSYGNEVLRTTFTGESYQFDVEKLAAGAYLARVDGEVIAFVVQK